MSPLTIPSSTLVQPIPIDTDGDMRIDLLGVTPTSNRNTGSPLMVWQNIWNASEPDSPMFSL